AFLQLLRVMDKALGPLVLQSYVTNLFFILVQLYLGLRPSRREDVVARLYLTWSFLHLVARLLLVSFTCSAIHETSKYSLVQLLNIPTERYSVEVWRLQQQVQEQEVGLSG
ncbi:Gustatory receptor for sugar taste 64f-like, partial [Homarus americanus]